MRIDLEVSEKLLIFAAESPLVCKILGSVVKKQLRKLIPPCMINTWVKPPQGGFIYKESMDKKRVLEHYKARFAQSMLTDDVTLANGHVVHRPDNWR